MTEKINGLHHVTALASDAHANNAFFTRTLGLRRVKKTVNFDAPEIYHLYYGDAAGTPGSVMTHFPFPGAARGRGGTGEVATTVFAIPPGTASWWRDRLAGPGGEAVEDEDAFGDTRVSFTGPDGEGLALVEDQDDDRAAWTGTDIPQDRAIRGFHSVGLRVRQAGATIDLLRFMGYEPVETRGPVTRLVVPGGVARVIDVEERADLPEAVEGAGSVHHVAFSVDDRDRQFALRAALLDAGYHPTPVIDRDYFWAIYFRTPGGILFEVATNEPGFDRDEDPAHLGEALKLPARHEHLRDRLERHLKPIE